MIYSKFTNSTAQWQRGWQYHGNKKCQRKWVRRIWWWYGKWWGNYCKNCFSIWYSLQKRKFRMRNSRTPNNHFNTSLLMVQISDTLMEHSLKGFKMINGDAKQKFNKYSIEFSKLFSGGGRRRGRRYTSWFRRNRSCV